VLYVPARQAQHTLLQIDVAQPGKRSIEVDIGIGEYGGAIRQMRIGIGEEIVKGRAAAVRQQPHLGMAQLFGQAGRILRRDRFLDEQVDLVNFVDGGIRAQALHQLEAARCAALQVEAG